MCSLGAYLIVITKREKVGELLGHTIWRLADTEIHSYKRTTTHLTEQQVMFFSSSFLLQSVNGVRYMLAKAQVYCHNYSVGENVWSVCGGGGGCV